VARLGVEAAEALEHAHALGVVHRDVKPGNLMLDGHGKLWVTDFGLARLGDEPGVTVSGDLLGTLRYMSPEQALARHGLVDHRTDVYSLGVTLYELLTLRPAVGGKDRQEVLRNIAFEEPIAPRRLEPGMRATWRRWCSRRWPRTPASATPRPRSWPTTSAAGWRTGPCRRGGPAWRGGWRSWRGGTGRW